MSYVYFVHHNLRLVDKTTDIHYIEPNIKWGKLGNQRARLVEFYVLWVFKNVFIKVLKHFIFLFELMY